MNDLIRYGWNEELFRHKESGGFRHLPHGRVTITHKTCYEVVTEEGLYLCEPAGHILYGRAPEEYPCTGDWVILQPAGGNKGVILDILPRRKTLYRRKSGTVSLRQTLAVHVDTAFIVQSLDANFNPRRIERFITQVLAEKIRPVLILTKADLDFNETEVTGALKHLAPAIPVFKTSIRSPETIDMLRQSIRPGETVVCIGSSGAGKSSLINALCRQEVLSTSGISHSTGKGRHTSARREMVLLPQSGVLIDTPGVREFGITSGETGPLSFLPDIFHLEQSCRFTNCTHTNEPGCAVIEAVENGTLDSDVYRNFLKLRKEALHFSASGHEKRRQERSFQKMINNVKKTIQKNN